MTLTKCIVGVEQEPRIQFTIYCEVDGPPKLLRLSNGDILVQRGTYASPGNHYCYQRMNLAELPDDVVISPWPRYSGLVGSGPQPLRYEHIQQRNQELRFTVGPYQGASIDQERFGLCPNGFQTFSVTCSDVTPPVETIIYASNIEAAKRSITSMFENATFDDDLPF